MTLCEKQRLEWLRARTVRKRMFIERSAMQAKFVKAQLIIAPKGRNGRSMSTALLAAHGIKAPGKEGA